MTKHGLAVEERYWAKVAVRGPDDCWPWQAGEKATGKGYGGFWDGSHLPSGKRRTILAHRFAWQLHTGEDPGELHVLHRCDNPPCQNPKHLFLGTHLDNMADRNAKGRVSKGRPPTLTPEQMQLVREAYAQGNATQDALAARFGVGRATIGRCIRAGR